jgi:hypothetical protein
VDVLPFHVAELLEPLPECREDLADPSRARAQDANPRDLLRLLRLAGKRRGRKAHDPECPEERSAVHWLTLSASRSTN